MLLFVLSQSKVIVLAISKSFVSVFLTTHLGLTWESLTRLTTPLLGISRNLTPIDETRQQFLCKSAYQRLNLSLLKEEKVFTNNFPLAGKQLLSDFISTSPIYVKKSYKKRLVRNYTVFIYTFLCKDIIFK